MFIEKSIYNVDISLLPNNIKTLLNHPRGALSNSADLRHRLQKYSEADIRIRVSKNLHPSIPTDSKSTKESVLVLMPQEPALTTTTSIPQQPQPKYNMQQPVQHYEQTCSEAVQQQQQPAEQQQTSNTNTSTLSGPTNNLETNKVKTPMCLINDLARYNKLQHQYQLTGQQGPAHNKVFTITLKLGNEEYEAEGASFKKAQHSAAALALQQTQYKHQPKTNRKNRSVRNGSGMLTPTVELNAILIKRGERAVYVLENGTPALQDQGYLSQSGYRPRHNIYGAGQPHYSYYPHHNNSARNYHAHYENCYYGQYQHHAGEPFSIRLTVGESEYFGMGETLQAARHDAAFKAIEDIIQKEMEDNHQQCPVVNENALPTTNIHNELNTELKSPISLVHEIALKRNVDVIFEVLSEKGSADMKVFVTQCRVGDLIAEGEGNGKKISKKRAAEEMLEKLSNLGPLPNSTNLVTMKSKRVINKKKRHSLIKVNFDCTEEINPISHLIQIQQAKKEKIPIYNVIEVRGPPRCCEFEIEASVSGHISTGVGHTKKIAKRNAAKALLESLGYTNSPATVNTLKPVIKVERETEEVEKPRKETYIDDKQESAIGDSGGHQLVPGLLLVSDQSGASQQTKDKLGSSKILDSGSDGASNANDEMYLTLVSLSTTASQICLGKGPTIETSHEKAALEEVHVLSELSLDDISPNKENNAESVHEGSTSSGSKGSAEPKRN